VSREPVLFVSHEGTLTGAPMMLLHFLRWLRDHSRIEPEIVLLRGGPLHDAFAEVGPTTVLGEEVGWPGTTAEEEALLAAGKRDRALERQRARVRPTLAHLQGARPIYLNSVASLRLLHHLPEVGPVIAHIHELESAMRWSMLPEDPGLLADRVDHVVAAADCVAANLVRNHAVAPEHITRVYEFIEAGRVQAPHRDRDNVRAQLGIGPDDHVIGGSGFGDWRKGLDLFVQLARRFRVLGRDDVHLVWVGDRAGGSEREQIDFDIAQSGVEDTLHLVGLQTHPFDWYRTFDVFALTSREDPYPLVGLEISLLEVPMVCFETAGGMTELVTRSTDEGLGESGVVVPYLDVEAMADAMIALIDDPSRRAEMGARAAHVVARDHEVEVAGPQLLDVIERVTARSLR
jgi:glycosyltransferase involved in cell wall biosynthesis